MTRLRTFCLLTGLLIILQLVAAPHPDTCKLIWFFFFCGRAIFLSAGLLSFRRLRLTGLSSSDPDRRGLERRHVPRHRVPGRRSPRHVLLRLLHRPHALRKLYPRWPFQCSRVKVQSLNIETLKDVKTIQILNVFILKTDQFSWSIDQFCTIKKKRNC